jgi:hypothetical protein
VNWHLEPDELRRYAASTLGTARAASVEAHLVACGECRARIATVVDPAAMASVARVKEAIDARIDAPAVGAVERVLSRLGVGRVDARIVAVTFTLLGSWLGASVVALAFVAVASATGPERAGYATFLVLAPLVPLAGVALTFGPRVDPTHELAVAAPVPSSRIVLLRALVVTFSAVAATAALSLVLPGWSALAFAWLLPALALTGASLALGTVLHPDRAAVALGVVWLAGAGAGLVGAPRTTVASFVQGFAAFRPAGQLLAALVAVASLALVTARHAAFETSR